MTMVIAIIATRMTAAAINPVMAQGEISINGQFTEAMLETQLCICKLMMTMMALMMMMNMMVVMTSGVDDNDVDVDYDDDNNERRKSLPHVRLHASVLERIRLVCTV